MKDVLTVEGLNFNYGAKTTLDNFSLSLSVPEGTFRALLGPNGAGKSRLFLLLWRLLMARSGRIHLGGHDLSVAPSRDRPACNPPLGWFLTANWARSRFCLPARSHAIR
ncbi:MAG: ATP-binding cassette domain-containing protein [Donghicola eburneus]|uniref:ATP-binding cassette domain-containing protein n=1 Tax=Primorskyibacter sp. 2E233 TaxID=3413431 RepID=UPI0026E9A3C9|nr:ATP-binding cassette domain-containing protein [Donghicola eburneus]MCI5038687.1 ATP-binding cassette domain-containing protein [Donghicola eburneus]